MKKKTLILARHQSGCNFWRFAAPVITMNSSCAKENKADVVIDDEFPDTKEEASRYHTIMICNWITPDIYEQFKNLVMWKDECKFKLILSIDDNPHQDAVPKYNNAYRCYSIQRVQDFIGIMLNTVDIIVVTTQYLKRSLCRLYAISEDKVCVIPNMIPLWWCNPDRRRVENFKKHKESNGLTAVVSSSLSHYDINGSGEKDDFSILEEAIALTPFVHWKVFGYVPARIKEKYENVVQIEGAEILNFPEALKTLDGDFIVAPILDNEFNRCKSNVKYLEASALGIPLLCSFGEAYSCVPDSLKFRDGRHLTEMLKNASTWSVKRYSQIIEDQKRWMLQPFTIEGSVLMTNMILEDNVAIWRQLFLLGKEDEKEEKQAFIQEEKLDIF